MRYGTRHKEWIGYLTKDQAALCEADMEQRQWLFERLKACEKRILRWRLLAIEQRDAAVREAAE